MDDSRSNEDASIPQMSAPSHADEQSYSARADEAARMLEDDDSGFVLGYN
jgi:hypothetical protein